MPIYKYFKRVNIYQKDNNLFLFVTFWHPALYNHIRFWSWATVCCLRCNLPHVTACCEKIHCYVPLCSVGHVSAAGRERQCPPTHTPTQAVSEITHSPLLLPPEREGVDQVDHHLIEGKNNSLPNSKTFINRNQIVFDRENTNTYEQKSNMCLLIHILIIAHILSPYWHAADRHAPFWTDAHVPFWYQRSYLL